MSDEDGPARKRLLDVIAKTGYGESCEKTCEKLKRVEIKLAAYALSEFFGVWFPSALAMTRCLHCGDPPSWHSASSFCREPGGGWSCPCRTYQADLSKVRR